MNILILEDEPRNAKRLIRLLNDIDRTFVIEGPLASIKETVEFFQSGKTTDLILADIRLILNRRPTMTWSAMKLPIGLRSLARLRTKGTSCYTIDSSRLCCHLASISLESSTISRLNFTRSMVHFSSL